MKELNKFLNTPKDISNLDIDEQSEILTLFFIGYIAKPIGISDYLLEKCVEAFNNNRGKIEREQQAIFKVLKNNNSKGD